MAAAKTKYGTIRSILEDSSIDGVYEDKADRRYKRLVARTILRLPEEVRNRVVKDVKFFISTLLLFGFANSRKISRNRKSGARHVITNLIFINLNGMIEAKRTDEEMMQVIAHEIAHIELKHALKGTPCCEKLAEEQTRVWGFRARQSLFERIMKMLHSI